MPTSSCTEGCSIKCPVQGIIIFKGLQFLSTRVALRHYMILKRPVNQQRISTSVAAASMRQGSVLNLGTGSGQDLCSCHTGYRDTGILVSSVVRPNCLAQCRGHAQPRAPNAKATGPVCKLTEPATSSQGWLGERRPMVSMPENHLKEGAH